MASTAAVQVNNSQIDNRIGTRPVSDERSTCDVRGGAQAAQGAVGGVGDGQGGRPEQADAFTSAREGDSRHLGAPVSSSGEIICPGTSQRRSSVPTEHQQSRPDPPATVKLRKQVEDLKRKIEWAADLEEEEKRRKAAEEGKKNISEEQEQEKKDLEVEIKELTKTFNSFNFEKRLAVHILTLKEEIKFPEPDGLLLTADYKEPFTEQLRRIEEAELESLGEFILQEYRKRVGKAEATRLTPWRKSKRSSTFLDIENQLVPTLPESYQEIKRLLLIEGQPVLKKALDVWESKRENYVNYIDRTKSNVAEVKNEIYQLIGFFSVFQGVLLTAVAQASQLHCPTSWIPISLSLFASVVTIAGVIQKLGQIKDLHNTVHYVQQSQKEMIDRILSLKGKPDGFRFAKFFDSRQRPEQRSRYRYSGSVIISLLVFALLFPISYWKILCG